MNNLINFFNIFLGLNCFLLIFLILNQNEKFSQQESSNTLEKFTWILLIFQFFAILVLYKSDGYS